MTTADVYTLIGEILRLVKSTSPAVLEDAMHHAGIALSSEERELVSNTLGLWLSMAEQKTPRADPTSRPTNREVRSPEAREVQAILSDVGFVPTRAELQRRLDRHFGKLLGKKIISKDSSQRLVARAVAAFEDATPRVQATVFRSLRRAYLASRGSSLADWSSAISESDK
jgi:hypothetical protein